MMVSAYENGRCKLTINTKQILVQRATAPSNPQQLPQQLCCVQQIQWLSGVLSSALSAATGCTTD